MEKLLKKEFKSTSSYTVFQIKTLWNNITIKLLTFAFFCFFPNFLAFLNVKTLFHSVNLKLLLKKKNLLIGKKEKPTALVLHSNKKPINKQLNIQSSKYTKL